MFCVLPLSISMFSQIVGTSETRHLLATCYYRSGYKRQALHLLKSGGEVLDVSSKLLCARCYLDLKE